MFLTGDETKRLNTASQLLGSGKSFSTQGLASSSAKLKAAEARAALEALLNPSLAKNAAFVDGQNRLNSERIGAAAARDAVANQGTTSGVAGNAGATGDKKPTVQSPTNAKDAKDKLAAQAKSGAKDVIDPRAQAANAAALAAAAKKKADDAKAKAEAEAKRIADEAKNKPAESAANVATGGLYGAAKKKGWL
jgi:colicin import membrane protein